MRTEIIVFTIWWGLWSIREQWEGATTLHMWEEVRRGKRSRRLNMPVLHGTMWAINMFIKFHLKKFFAVRHTSYSTKKIERSILFQFFCFLVTPGGRVEFLWNPQRRETWKHEYMIGWGECVQQQLPYILIPIFDMFWVLWCIPFIWYPQKSFSILFLRWSYSLENSVPD